jgi:hypothetical protein
MSLPKYEDVLNGPLPENKETIILEVPVSIREKLRNGLISSLVLFVFQLILLTCLYLSNNEVDILKVFIALIVVILHVVLGCAAILKRSLLLAWASAASMLALSSYIFWATQNDAFTGLGLRVIYAFFTLNNISSMIGIFQYRKWLKSLDDDEKNVTS